MSEISSSELVIGGLYEHYKGMRYRVHGVVLHSETLEELVHYEALYENPQGKMWVRPKKMFLENVKVFGTSRPRFRFIGS
ncbi:MAG: DUF1653 domain-containing protein [Bdellovibrionaceae bacterium]|nr:DUF1653 domain-containing protein [Pseudobdellovibrionaceae bacterium]